MSNAVRFAPDANKIQIAVPKPKNAREFDRVRNLFEKALIRFDERSDGFVSTSNRRFEVAFIPPADIPFEIERGLPLGVCGLDMIVNSRRRLIELYPLGMGNAEVVLAKRIEDDIAFPGGVNNLRIGTAMYNLTADFLKINGISADIIGKKGALETSCRGTRSLDLIVDQKVSGDSLRAAALMPLAKIMDSEYFIVANEGAMKRYADEIGMLLARLKSSIAADKKYYVLFNAMPKVVDGINALIEEGKIPCGNSPTVNGLKTPGAYAYAVVVNEDEVMETEWRLKDAGAGSILAIKVDGFIGGNSGSWGVTSADGLYATIMERKKNPRPGGSTTPLLENIGRLLAKFNEERFELERAMEKGVVEKIRWEAGDLFFPYLVGVVRQGLDFAAIRGKASALAQTTVGDPLAGFVESAGRVSGELRAGILGAQSLTAETAVDFLASFKRLIGGYGMRLDDIAK